MLLALHWNFQIEFKLFKMDKKFCFGRTLSTQKVESVADLPPHLQKDLGITDCYQAKPSYQRYL